jgi:maltose alpha-D-glucosyltransferase/alpha-amylase
MPKGEYGPLAVNVADQRRQHDSLLNWMERVIRRRRETPELGWGAVTMLDVVGDERAVLAHRCDWESSSVVALHNLSATPSCSARSTSHPRGCGSSSATRTPTRSTCCSTSR